MKSASNEKGINFLAKIIYSFKLFKMRIRSRKSSSVLPLSDIHRYAAILEHYCAPGSQKLSDHRVLEIGYGARPWRLISLLSFDVDIYGIDLDQPAYGWNFKRLTQILKRNGFERFAKSFVRSLLFDGADIRKLRKELKALDRSLVIDKTRMVVGNAAESHHFKVGSFTFAFSEDVFEHIPADALPLVIRNVKNWLAKGSIFVVTPNIYTGINGGHDPDFYPHRVLAETVSPDRAWSHLWDPDFKVDTYLNKLRLCDYVSLFSEHFEILEMKQKYDELGKKYLTPAILKKLTPTYSKEELLTNQVSFILRS